LGVGLIGFQNLVNIIRQFKLNCAPSRESDIEIALENFLKSRGLPVKRQFQIRNGRLDLVVDSIIIEVKKIGQKNIAEQLDKYSSSCDGLIVVCWIATQPLKLLFSKEKMTAKIPIELIEVRRACGMV